MFLKCSRPVSSSERASLVFCYLACPPLSLVSWVPFTYYAPTITVLDKGVVLQPCSITLLNRIESSFSIHFFNTHKRMNPYPTLPTYLSISSSSLSIPFHSNGNKGSLLGVHPYYYRQK